MADEKDSPKAVPAPEKVDKKATSGTTVYYRNQFVPGTEQSMPKEDWDRLKADNQLGNVEFIREEKA